MKFNKASNNILTCYQFVTGLQTYPVYQAGFFYTHEPEYFNRFYPLQSILVILIKKTARTLEISKFHQEIGEISK